MNECWNKLCWTVSPVNPPAFVVSDWEPIAGVLMDNNLQQVQEPCICPETLSSYNGYLRLFSYVVVLDWNNCNGCAIIPL